MHAVKEQSASYLQVEAMRGAFENAVKIATKLRGKNIILAKQILDELRFNEEQITALEAIANIDKTTVGVTGQTPENCPIETANTWLFAGYDVIIIDDGSTALSYPKDPHLIVLKPEEFIKRTELMLKFHTLFRCPIEIMVESALIKYNNKEFMSTLEAAGICRFIKSKKRH